MLKLLRSVPDPEGEFANRFLREARIAANFTDPRLCPVYDAGVLDGIPYFTMPLLAGETLESRIGREGAFDPEEAARLVATIARAIAIAHASGVVHRDLKPANIMMTPSGLPVVLDFGLARSKIPGGCSRDRARRRLGHARLHGARTDRRRPANHRTCD